MKLLVLALLCFIALVFTGNNKCTLPSCPPNCDDEEDHGVLSTQVQAVPCVESCFIKCNEFPEYSTMSANVLIEMCVGDLGLYKDACPGFVDRGSTPNRILRYRPPSFSGKRCYCKDRLNTLIVIL